ncbi:MAG TPA: alcohol dehydrogenase catalytic domain-containing protein [Candidatus Limnocylindria bacterium]|nr:alcohol dehydrogenase catalytic domain-containing protein [Candidatus Limnocylindria bacterium]
MKAAVCVAGAIELREWPEPVPGPGELVLRVSGCGLCGSDILKINAAAPGPAVLGHEVVGQVAAVGPGVRRFAPGERLVVAHHVPCFDCHYCRHGSPSMCRHFKRVNLDPGGFAELVRVPAPNVAHAAFRLPAEMTDETASFTEPLACCLRAVKRTRVGAGDTALVVGLGSIGCLLAQLLALEGARVLASDLLDDRRALGRGLGARVFDADADLDVALREATEGRGADLVILTAGGAAVLPAAAARVRDGGTLHYFAGGAGDSLPLPLGALYHRELTLTATYSSSPAELEEAFALLAAGRIRLDGLISHRLPLGRLGEGVELMRRHEAVKVYVIP